MRKPSDAPPASELHAHRAGDAAHRHVLTGRNPKVLAAAAMLTLVFAALEAFAGVLSNSLALISDAGHMVTDSASLAFALLAQFVARRPPSPKNSFGLGRAEALAAFINALAMLVLIGWISLEAISRFRNPLPVQGQTVFTVAAIGLLINLLVAWLLSRDRSSVNTRAALVHVMGDLLGSIAAIAAGVIIYFTGWLQIDPLLSIAVSLLLLKSTHGVLRESYHFLMEGVPRQIDYLQVGSDLAAIDGIRSVHDLHVWEMTPGEPALIGHVEISDLQRWPQILREIRRVLLTRHHIDHVTLQPELPGMVEGEEE
ncbi:cation diffusion facilitator family transporter [Noviherbaspirillum aerium]|uniref:cation diffusion facilitator family transporter n=1 Tax=Noviherbaspirillum aerium TaxID=2588497 RepID=UPI00124F2DDC|nr:cation diffusion facilitator family transporter [Noviherbaspirillum aerium]